MRKTEKPVTRIFTTRKVVALTFDACETVHPSYFDTRILNFLISYSVPSTIFVSGKFALRNAGTLKKISAFPFFEIENHSFNHYLHMERLPDPQIVSEVKTTEEIILSITGYRTRFFRFPGGNYNTHALEIVESLGYRVIQWTFPSGDPDKHASALKLFQWVTWKTRPGDILIFHINGRGWHTHEALPRIYTYLIRRGYKFVKIEDVIH